MKFSLYLFTAIVVVASFSTTPVLACSGHGALMPDGSVVPIVHDNVPPGGQLVIGDGHGGWINPFTGQHVGNGPPPPPTQEERDVDYNG